MSDTYFYLKAEFSDKKYRDKAIAFLDDEGQTDEDEVEEPFRNMFPLIDDVEPPLDMRPVGENELWAYFELFADGIITAQFIMLTVKETGAAKVYGMFGDLDGNEAYWTVEGSKLMTMYTLDEDESIDQMLLELEDEAKLETIIPMYEGGVLQGREEDMY